MIFITTCLIHVESLKVLSPPEIEGDYISALISFGEVEKRTQFQPFTGKVQLMEPIEGCNFPTEMKSAELAPIAFIKEETSFKTCQKRLDQYYLKLQEANFTGVIVGKWSFYYAGDSLGNFLGFDVSQLSIPITYIAGAEEKLLKDQLKVSEVEVEIDADLGPFYQFAFGPGMVAYRVIIPLAYFLIAIYSFLALFLETYKKRAVVFNNFFGITLCSGLMCLIRGLKVSIQEHDDYFMFHPRPLSLQCVSGPFFWFPIVVGTTAYTITAFAWIAMMRSIETNSFAYKIRKPMMGFFIALVPFSIILPVIDVFVYIGSFFILCVCVALVGLFETIVFTYYGSKILSHLSYTTKQLNSRRSDLEKKITFFLMGALASWVIVVIISLVFVVMGTQPTNKPTQILPLAALRDTMIIVLAILILTILKRSATKITTSTGKKNSKKSKEYIGSSNTALSIGMTETDKA